MNRKVFNITDPGRVIPAALFVMTVLWSVSAVFAAGTIEQGAVKQEKIRHKISVKNSPFLQKGWMVWLKEGRPGIRNTASREVRLFGAVVRRNKIYETGVLKKPVDAIVVKGTSKKNNPINVPKETYAHYIHDMEATAYDPSPESNSVEWAGITALGWRTRYGIAAVDPKVIALRSLIYVDGYGFAWTGDVGGDIKGKRIDLCYNTTSEALKWGRRKVRVYVLGTKPWDYYRAKKNKADGVSSKPAAR
ncbi:MAG: G5 domain-containing protein [Spirochaetia bacterium]|nr:G5 domain-containing protein [Spirochaetia bacterium]